MAADADGAAHKGVKEALKDGKGGAKGDSMAGQWLGNGRGMAGTMAG